MIIIISCIVSILISRITSGIDIMLNINMAEMISSGMHWYSFPYRKCLNIGSVLLNKKHFTGTEPSNMEYLTSTVPRYREHLTCTL